MGCCPCFLLDALLPEHVRSDCLRCIILRGCPMNPDCPLQGKCAHVLDPGIARVLRHLQENVPQALQTESAVSPFSHCLQFNHSNLIPFPKLTQLWGRELCLPCLEVPVILHPGLCQSWKRLNTSWQFWQAWGTCSCHFCCIFLFLANGLGTFF